MPRLKWERCIGVAVCLSLVSTPLFQQKEAVHHLRQVDRVFVGHRPCGVRVLQEAGAEG